MMHGAWWGTVENVPAGPRREERKCNPRNTLPPLVPMNRRKRLFHMVFTTIGEPQAHDDRLLTCGRLVIGLPRLNSSCIRWRIANPPQVNNLPHNPTTGIRA